MSRSRDLLERARRVIPGGVNSPVRAFAAVGGDPPFIVRGEGAELIDEEGHRYLDLIGSWGPLILGHADKLVLGSVMAAMANGSSFGAPTRSEVDFAELLISRVPSLDMVRLCSSGTEATMHAIRLARGYTGRDLIVKMDGCYHGAHDAVLVSAGSGVATFAQPGSPGIPASVAANTLVAPYNDLAAVRALFEAHPGAIAGVILEPVAGNMGCVPPVEGYLEGLRALTEEQGALLIFDEVMTGCRLAAGGAQERFAITPDLTTLGKIVGGGFPLAAFGGRAEIMEKLAPQGPVYQAGTLSGNPVAVAAGMATLQAMTPERYQRLEAIGAAVEAGIAEAVAYHGCSLSRVGSMFTVFFRDQPPRNMAEVRECDFEAFGRFHRAALGGGVYLPPSQYEAAFLPSILTEREVDWAMEGITAALVASVG